MASVSDPSFRILRCRDRTVRLDAGPVMVGILNITEDSFYDGGRYHSLDAAVLQAQRLVAEGAGIIDVGGQSTRPGFSELSVDEEIARVVPVIEKLCPLLSVPLSIDTYKLPVARAALLAGAHLLNDVYGLQRDPAMAELAAEFGCAVIAMHQENGFKELGSDPIPHLLRFFAASRDVARRAGVADDQVVLDPGIGFGKTHEQNLQILARLDQLRAAGLPLLLGASRKSVIGNVLELPPPERLEGTLATTVLAVWHGVELIRVHDVAANARAAKMAAALRGSRVL